MPVILELKNFSDSLEDITLENFRVSERIIRWHERNLGPGNQFEVNVWYLGIFFQAILKLNYEVFLYPNLNPTTYEIEYETKKAIDLDELYGYLYDINIASLQVDLKFIDIFGFIPNSFCKREIRVMQQNIYKAFGLLMEFVD